MGDFKYKEAKAVARELGFDEGTMIDLLENKHVPGIKLGETWLVSTESLVEFLRREESRQFEGKVPGNGNGQLTRRRRSVSRRTGTFEFSLLGRRQTARSSIDVLTAVLQQLATRDPEFLSRFRHEGGRARRYVARTPEALYPGRPDLADQYSRPIQQGWWMGTNYSSREIENILRKACEVAGLRWGIDFSFIQRAKNANRIKALAFVGAAEDRARDVARRHDAYFAESISSAGP